MPNNKNQFISRANQLGTFFVILFIICFAWFFLRSGSAEIKSLHNNLLALSFFGWSGFDAKSFILGSIQSFIWGYIAVLLWQLAKIINKN